MANTKLQKAKDVKNDEFYTQYFDIEREIAAYIEYNPDVFRGKTILLPCDDPEWSNFTKFFAQKFETFGIKKLISTSYAAASKNYKNNYKPTLFETNDPQYDKTKTVRNGKIFTLTRDKTGDGKIDVSDLEWRYLDGDGDFRSDEIIKLRDEADIIITNPPFSLFREFLAWIMAAEKQFLIIGSLNAIKYNEVFPLIQRNKIWLGNNYDINGGAMFYEIPEDVVNLDQVREIRISDSGKKIYITRVQGVRWFTNIDHGRHHEPLPLMTAADVIKFGTKKQFEKYYNYDAIEVSLVKNIPRDYVGEIGVPISFLDKYNPEQFEIVGISRRLGKPMSKIAKKGTYSQGGPCFYLDNGDGTYKRLFDRVVIKCRNS